ncbi:response regulator transcription factor [Paenibacillus sediminis]|uniref:DNA-binding response OmpR family regulator n=1 Tax=Paenibacillus sediminis TaxID=664909 RepID=A0ABS4H384_9BACL|nr:response regulator transcription factor [Paenibacillus sediminis]MBP1936990.1 DNA-binding response OmpR family regulator [Paenibacillus sediminis]
MGYQIMIVEDDDKIAEILGSYIKRYGYDTVRAVRMDDIKQEFAEHKPDLVLLDINLPHYDGFYWCRQIRTISNAPIIFISARTGEMDQVMAIENGGDDYITKPFHLEIVLAKIKSALRRAYGEYSASQEQSDTLNVHGLSFDRTRNSLEWNGKIVDLTRNECLLFDALTMKTGRIMSREKLLGMLWDDVQFVDDNTLTVNVTRLRKKLEEIGINDAIETVRGQGYRLNMVWNSGQSEDKG